MQQVILPFLQPGVIKINNFLSAKKKDGMWYYFVGMTPVFCHDENDKASFRMFTSQLIVSGQCKNIDIINAFGVSSSSVKRGVKKYKTGGVIAFFQARKGRSGTVLTEEVKKECQDLLDNGWSRKEICKHIDIKSDTLRKAIKSGRLHEANIAKIAEEDSTSKSKRTVEDAKAGGGMGVACTRTVERVLASKGQIANAPSKFTNCIDLPMGGVICSLPALIACGLFSRLNHFPQLPAGYYSVIHIITIFAFIFLTRIKVIDRLRFQPSGELGKLIGLDRIPEVKTMREKLSLLSKDEKAVQKWAGELSKDWMIDSPDLAGVLFIDGHVSLYFGQKTNLPKRYISRLRLCMSGTSFYYVNDILGQPYFYIEKPVDPGLLKVMEEEIVPRLLKEVPNQPTEEELEANPLLHRFILVFDREGYSPGFFKRMWESHRIACISYNKFPNANWEESEFEKHEVKMPHGEIIEMKLAERGTLIGSKKEEKIWVREVRRQTKSGHQTSIISTGYVLNFLVVAMYIFSRWAQENFFKYMHQHFDFDKVMEFAIENISGLTQVVNPAWKDEDNKIRSCQNKLNYRLKKFGNIELHPEVDQNKLEKQIKEKAELIEEIGLFENEIKKLKENRSKISKHIDFQDLPGEMKFEKLKSSSRLFLNTVKMIAYRSETAMASLLQEYLNRKEDARPIILELFKTEADIFPDAKAKTLNVNVHRMATLRNDFAIKKLMEKLNETETTFPGTNLKIKYNLIE